MNNARLYQVLRGPVFSEKSQMLGDSFGVQVFKVDSNATKLEIKKAVESAYGVSVEKVRTLNSGPERKMRYTKTGIQKGKTNATKKAIVQVAEGDAIDFYSNL